MELLIARNPDPDSSLPFLLWLPIADGLVFSHEGHLAADHRAVLPPGRGHRLAR